MSQVNDALKRAKQAQKKGPPPAIASPTSRHAESVHRKHLTAGLFWLFTAVALVAVIGCVLWFVVRTDGASASPAIVVQAKTASGRDHRSSSVAQQTEPISSAFSQPVAPTASAMAADAVRATVAQPGVPTDASFLAPSSSASASSPTDPVALGPSRPATVTQTVVVASGLHPPPPLPKLQGIFYQPNRPRAVLDGRSAWIGKMLGEYLVVDISQQNVTVVRAGQTNILEMPD